MSRIYLASLAICARLSCKAILPPSPWRKKGQILILQLIMGSSDSVPAPWRLQDWSPLWHWVGPTLPLHRFPPCSSQLALEALGGVETFWVTSCSASRLQRLWDISGAASYTVSNSTQWVATFTWGACVSHWVDVSWVSLNMWLRTTRS